MTASGGTGASWPKIFYDLDGHPRLADQSADVLGPSFFPLNLRLRELLLHLSSIKPASVRIYERLALVSSETKCRKSKAWPSPAMP